MHKQLQNLGIGQGDTLNLNQAKLMSEQLYLNKLSNADRIQIQVQLGVVAYNHKPGYAKKTVDAGIINFNNL